MDHITCARLGCDHHAIETTLAGATRVPTCHLHTREYLERYPDSADTVWPIGLATRPRASRSENRASAG